MMQVYIAAPYPMRADAIALMHEIEAAGFGVTSTWLREPDAMSDAYARLDLADVDRADVLVALSPAEWVDRGTGGRHVEFGYALAQRKPIVLIGERGNIFHHLSDVRVVNETQVLDTLRAIESALSTAA